MYYTKESSKVVLREGGKVFSCNLRYLFLNEIALNLHSGNFDSANYNRAYPLF